jgi:hypothetical protein
MTGTSGARSGPSLRTEAAVAALKKTQTLAQQEAEALIRLIESNPVSPAVGQNVNVYA